ncbi:hypothetical protein wCIFem_06280 [Wolbachia pipientis]
MEKSYCMRNIIWRINIRTYVFLSERTFKKKFGGIHNKELYKNSNMFCTNSAKIKRYLDNLNSGCYYFWNIFSA